MIAAKKPGHIVTVSSLGGLMGSALAAPYSAAKAAVVNLMESYRMSLAKFDIGVSVVCPANIKTNIAEATRIRPAKFGDSGYVANEDTIASLHSIHIHGMEPVELAERELRVLLFERADPIAEAASPDGRRDRRGVGQVRGRAHGRRFEVLREGVRAVVRVRPVRPVDYEPQAGRPRVMDARHRSEQSVAQPSAALDEQVALRRHPPSLA